MTQHAPAPAATAARPRDPYLDNVKLAVVLLVVCGHAWALLLDRGRFVGGAYLWVYAFHMPLFIVVCGFLSRGFDSAGRRWRALVRTVVLPYLVFQVLYTLLDAVQNGREIRLNLLEPYWLLWFLPALFVWRLLVPLWSTLRFPVVTSLAISCLAGIGEVTDQLDLGRVLQLLPFFVLGLRLRREHLDRLHTRSVRVAAAVVLVVSLVLAGAVVTSGRLAWVSWVQTAGDLDVGYGRWVLTHLAMVVIATVLGAAVLAVIPTRRLPVTAWGTNTLYVFLLHGLVLRVAYEQGWFDLSGRVDAVLLTVGALLLGLALASPLVHRLTHWVVEPALPWLFRREASTVR